MYVEGAKEATPPRERRSKLYSNPPREICNCKNASYSFTLKQNNCTPANSVHILLLGLFIYYLCFTLLLHVCTLWEGWGTPQYMCGKLKDFWSWFSFHIFYLKFFFLYNIFSLYSFSFFNFSQVLPSPPYPSNFMIFYLSQNTANNENHNKQTKNTNT